ncbi:MAG: tRNA (guanine(26)-N(2))-dimethyltransferase [Candidatus Bathyarchaeota archaeon B63]|nr:MAG: tRNA (guanine(26)-N(2))-dimethyltransferase [Candidatus Bathyarchaeota archaeon B63]
MRFDFPVEFIREGAARLAVPRLEEFKRAPWEYAPSKAPVFYNPAMKLNRDVAVLAVQAYQRTLGRELLIAEPLAGCGVRGIRFALEIEGVRHVYMNDINPVAFKMAAYNVEINGLTGHVSVLNEDANLFMNRHAAPHRRFDCIDIDPFGSPVRFLDSAVRALRDGGLLAMTATDMAPLCGVHPEAAFRKYGGLPLRTEYCHEIGLRLMIGVLARAAAKHEIGIRVLFSHKSEHYVRAYATLIHGAKRADESLGEMGYILHCFSCFHREAIRDVSPFLSKRCPECGGSLRAAGPLWLGRLSNGDICGEMERIAAGRAGLDGRVRRLLRLVKGETDAPATYFVIDKISDRLNLPSPPLWRVIEKLSRGGFEAQPTHFNTRGIKTDAPARVVVEAVKSLA